MSKLIKTVYLPLLLTTIAVMNQSPTLVAGTQSLRAGGYFCGTDGTCMWEKPGDPNWLFSRYSYIMGYAECAQDIAEWRTKSPGCQLVLYTSGTDMPGYKKYDSHSYNAARKANYIRDRLTQLSVNEETAYMHFYNTTKIKDWNGTSWDTMTIQGTNSLIITAKDSVSRVPNGYVHYMFMAGNTYSDPARLSPNLASSKLRQAYKEYLTQVFNSEAAAHFPGKSGEYDGIYFDNYAPWSMQGSNLVSGGLVVETGTSPANLLTWGTQTYADWCWVLMQQFGREVRDTLQMADQWSNDRKKKSLAYNCAQTFRNSYLFPDSSGGDAFNYEFGWDPVFCNNSSTYRLENLYQRDSIKVTRGATSFWTSPVRVSYGGKGTTTMRKALYNNFAFYLAARADSTWLFLRPSLGNAYGVFLNPGFDTLSWIPAMEYELGWPAQHYQLVTSGASPDQAGTVYKIWRRDYPYGRVYIRPRDGFEANWGDMSTPINVDLGGNFRQLQTDGTLGSVVSQISLRGGEGAIMIPAVSGECTTPPSIPTASTPSNGAPVATVTPSLCINSSTQSGCSQAIRYHFQVSTVNTFASITQENSSVTHLPGTSCWTVPTALAPGTTFYWRTRAGNGTSWSSWSATNSFVTPNSAPGVPALSSPANGATVTTRQPSLVCGNVTDPEGSPVTYHFQVSAVSNFATVASEASNIVQGAGGTTTWQVAVQLNNTTTYYWRARSSDGVNASAWSASRSFFVSAAVANNPPTTPSLNSPANSSNVTTVTPQLRVNNSTDPEGNTITYQFDVYDSNQVVLLAQSPMVAQGSGTTAWTVTPNLVNGVRYKWRARAYDGQAWSNYMTTAEFRVLIDVNIAPSVPTPITPVAGQSVLGEPVMLVTGNSSDLDGDDLFYSFRVFSDSLLTKQVEISSGRPENSPYTSYLTVSNYEHNKPYWWTVRAFDGVTYSDWAAGQKFQHLDLVLDVEDAAAAVAPADGSIELTTTPVFRMSWVGDRDSVACTFEIATDADFVELFDAGVTVGYGGEVSWIPNRTLANQTTYYWRGRVASDGYTPVAKFTVNSPIFVSPNPFSYLDGEIVFHNLPAGSNLEVFTPSGDLVYRADNLNGDFKWGVMNAAGEKLASGVFLYYIRFEDKTHSDKFIVVR